MATQSLSPEMTSYARLCLAINEVCTKSLRDVLLRNVPSQDIKQALVARWGHQYNKPMFNKYPYSVLFPNHQLDPNFSVSDCDLSLLYFLIRNVSSVQKPLLGWGKSVMNNPQDTSIGANVERLNELRNTVIHLQEPRLSNEEFNSYWNKLRDCVTDIDKYLGGTMYQQKLECLKTDDMDPDYANRLIETFRGSLQDLQARQHEQGQTLSDIREVLNQGLSEVTNLIKDENRQLPQIAKDVNETKDIVKLICERMEGKGERRASTQLEIMKGNDLLICQRRLEYLGQRLQDLAVEIGDGQGALWFKQNLWFLNKPAEFIDDVLFGVGKICNHLSSYLLFKKQKIKVHFPLKTFAGILHDISDTLSITRDILLHHPEEKLSVKQSQIELFWKDCIPFLFIFEEKNCSFLQSDQIPTFLYAIMDLIPTTIQVGLGFYCSSEPRLRGLDCFRRTCLRLLEVLVDQGEFLTMADQMEPVLISFLRQWVLYAIEVLQNGVKTTMTESKEKSNDNNQERQRPKTWSASSQDDQGDFEEYKTKSESDAEMCLGPLKVCHSSRVRATCLPSRWLKVAGARMVCCPNELRKHCLEEAGLKENQKLVSNIYLAAGSQNSSCKGIKLHCPLIKKYEDLSLRLFVKVKKGEVWRTAKTKWEQLYDKGQFLTFEEEFVEGFMAVEEIPMVLEEIGPKGGRLSTEYDKRIEAEIPTGVKREISTVKMMIQPVDRPREQLYRESCPDVFHCIKSTSIAVEIDGASSEIDIALKIPFDVMKDAQTKILVLKYTNDHIEVRDASNLEKGDGNFYTITSRNGGTVLATVDPDVYGQNTSDSDIRQEMEVILGKKQLCKLLIFVELQHNKLDLDSCVFQIVCAEKYRVDEVIREKSKSGLVEVPKSQSSDRLLKQADDIKLEMKGSIHLDADIPMEAYTLTYLEGSDNYLRFPVKLLDRNGRITFVLRHGKDNSILHTFFCPISTIMELMSNTSPTSSSSRYSDASEGHDEDFLVDEDESELQRPLSEISISSSTTESASQSSGQSVNQRDRYISAALKILARNSIVLLAKQMSGEEGHLLRVVLGMKPERTNQIYKMYRYSGSLANFYILYEWRGRRVHPDQADQLVRGLQDIGRADLATTVTNVLKKNRPLSSADFETEITKRKARR